MYIARDSTIMHFCPSELILDNSTGVVIRPPLAEDLEGLREFFSRMPRSELLIYRDDVAKWEVIEGWFKRPPSRRGGLKLIALENGEIIAVGTLHQEGFFWKNASEITLIVDPRYRGRGLGFRMFKTLLTEALRGRREKIIVRYTPDNESFIRILDSFGFKPEAVVRSHVDDDQTGQRKDVVIASYDLGNWMRRFELYHLIYGGK